MNSLKGSGVEHMKFLTFGTPLNKMKRPSGENCILCPMWLDITEPWENEMRVVVLARKNVAAMKTGARHLLRSVGVLSPSTGTQFFPSAFANDVNVSFYNHKNFDF